MWRKNDKYEVWFETSPIAHPRSCLIGTSLPIDSRLTAKFPAILTHQSFHLTCFIEISEYVIFEDFSAFPCIFFYSTPPASKSPAPIMDLGAQDQQKNPKSEGLQWDLGILELDLRFRGGLGLSPIGLENFRGGLSPSPPLNLKSNSKTLKSTSKMPKSCML